MSCYITIDFRTEIKKRLEYIDGIRENLKDIEAELHEVVERNTLSKTHGSGDVKETSGNGSSYYSEPSIELSMREVALRNKQFEYKSIIHDFERGWNLLNQQEKEILINRFQNCQKQETVARHMSIARRTVCNIESEALRKMEHQMIKI